MPTIPPLENVNVTILRHQGKGAKGLRSLVDEEPALTSDGCAEHTGCKLSFTILQDESDPAAGPPPGLLLTVTAADLAEPITLPVAADSRPSFPPDGSVVLPLGTSAADVCTAVLSSPDARVAERLGQDVRRLLEASAGNLFDAKTDAASSFMYFHYYGMLQHQQNMLQDMTRTGTYYWAIMNNRQDFQDKVVVDVGAGTGILSLFAAQAGARKVYAVEASNMVKFAQKLFDGNGADGARIEILHGKAETLLAALPERADVLISEPMGTLLVNERMLETYIFARKHMLKPGGLMFPNLGRIFTAPFSDAILFDELRNLASFWTNPSFYGVNLTSLHADAYEGYCGKVVIDSFDPGILMAPYACTPIDFTTADETDLHDLEIPLSFTCKGPTIVHGVACWFDVQFPGTAQQMWLSTAPGMAATHWFQLRCVLQAPIHVHADGQLVSGTLRLKAHNAQSYDVHLRLESPGNPAVGAEPQAASGIFDLKDPYYRQLRQTWAPPE